MGPVVAGSDVAQLVLREKLVPWNLIVLHLNVHGEGLELVVLSPVHQVVGLGNRIHKLVQQEEPRFSAPIPEASGKQPGVEGFEVVVAVDVLEVCCVSNDVEQIRICKVLAGFAVEGGVERGFRNELVLAKEQFWCAFALLDAHVGIVADIGAVNIELGVHDRATFSEESGFLFESGSPELRFELHEGIEQQLVKLEIHLLQRIGLLHTILILESSFRGAHLASQLGFNG